MTSANSRWASSISSRSGLIASGGGRKRLPPFLLGNRVRPELRRVGNEQSPVVVVDEFSGRVEKIREIAEALAPYPRLEGNYYPGLRRVIEPADAQANEYVEFLCRDAGQFIAGAFNVEGFTLIEASFSMVTTSPSALSRPQRAPHFDSPDPKHYALLHYIRVPEGSGTAFYRQRSTGIERITEANIARFVTTAEREAAQLLEDSGYISGSDEFYEQIALVEAVPDRLLIYQGSLLHSGVIPPGMAFSADPREGRLTANLFVQGH
jgi:hypothetical protein